MSRRRPVGSADISSSSPNPPPPKKKNKQKQKGVTQILRGWLKDNASESPMNQTRFHKSTTIRVVTSEWATEVSWSSCNLYQGMGSPFPHHGVRGEPSRRRGEVSSRGVRSVRTHKRRTACLLKLWSLWFNTPGTFVSIDL